MEFQQLKEVVNTFQGEWSTEEENSTTEVCKAKAAKQRESFPVYMQRQQRPIRTL
jgi:hypothetical protein